MASDFPALLRGLAAASGAGFKADAAIFTQALTVQPNAWFGIGGGRAVTVVWYHLNYAETWASMFDGNAPVAALVAAAFEERSFPHYDTLDTDLSATELNLLASLTCWTVTDKVDAFTRLFAPSPGCS